MANPADALERSVLFLPGAGGAGKFWRGVGDRLPRSWEKRFLDWPGLGDQPPRPDVNDLAGLLRLAEEALRRPSLVVAQSMGGIIAVQLALRHPELVSELVLTATSGGVNIAALGGADWRPDFLAAFPHTARWILDAKADLAGRLGELAMPTLLLWGDADPISPPQVGRHLASRIPRSRLAVVPGGRHSLAADRPALVASLICSHIGKGSCAGPGLQDRQ